MIQNNIKVSVMTIKDLEEIKNILETDFDNFWNYNIFKSELSNPHSTYFVAKQGNEIVGFIGILIVLDEADITNIVIKKSYRGNGLSKIIFKYIIDFCKTQKICKINLEVNSTNLVAINLYKKFEFKQVGLRKNYYQNGDAILFTLNI